MSSVRAASLRNARANRHNSSVSKVQCGGHRSEDLCVTSPTISAAHQVRMCKLRSTHLRGARTNRRNSSLSRVQYGGHCSEDLYVTSSTTSATRVKISEEKTLRNHRHFDRPLCGGASQDQKAKKMDGRFHRRAELVDSSVSCVPWGPVFRRHFRSQEKEIRV